MIVNENEKSGMGEILIVDDTPASLQLLTRILTDHGYLVRPASGGSLALRSVEVKAPDLIILDVKMPDMDGFEVCRRLKANAQNSNIPVLFVSALGEVSDKAKGFEAGGVDYITKPFEAEEVLARVSTHLKLHELNEHLEQKVNERTGELIDANRRLQQEISEHKRTKEKIIQSLREKETLIRELYHRIKNTMQVINGMLALQAAEYPENAELQRVIKNTEKRIEVISLVHQMLYNNQDLSRISIKEYIHELSSLIMRSFGVSKDRISLSLEVEDQYFLLDTAIPFGIILNELMTNSLKYAFPDSRKGVIAITLSREKSNKNLLHYSDNGIGVPDGFIFKNQNTLGLQLIYSIGESQMRGKIAMENNNGVSCVFEFQNNLYEARV